MEKYVIEKTDVELSVKIFLSPKPEKEVEKNLWSTC